MKGKKRYVRGIELITNKELTKDREVICCNPDNAEEFIYRTDEHIGAPGKVIVSKGQHVDVGQKLAEADGKVSACLCSSVSGKVLRISDKTIVVANDREYRQVTGFGIRRDYMKLSAKEILAAICEAGVIGMGGAGFPTHIKYAVANPEQIRYIIPNDAECEPYITADYRLMVECSNEVEEGLKILNRLFANAVILRRKSDKNMCVEHYPQGAEKQLIYSLTGERIPSSLPPVKAGYIVSNVHTLSAVYKAVSLGIPVIDRIVTVSGDGINNPGNYRIRIGMPCSNLIEAAGGLSCNNVVTILGGPMMGTRIERPDVPLMRTTSGITCLTSRGMGKDKPETACIRCGRCVSVCPCRLRPYDAFSQNECIGCGCCSYVCPAGREVTYAKYRKGGGTSA